MSGADPLTLIRCLYHFTDTRNLPLIRQRQGLFSLAVLRRDGAIVPSPGGNEWSHDADRRGGLDQYVHLCFRKQHPMEYRAKQEGRIADSIFLEISADILTIPGVLFTPDVSNKSGVSRHTLEQARKMIDFEVLYTRTDWRDPAIRERLQNAAKCEILVPGGVPLTMIRNLPNG
jgi:ssDNA thymidine ADP-ribosyltransferase, DarT